MKDLPLGHTVNGSPHSVCVSLPTIADVIGYEEHDPAVRGALRSGYPRFVEPPLRGRWQDAAAAAHGGGPAVWRAVASPRIAERAVAYAGGETAGVCAREWRGGQFVVAPPGETSERVKAILQHTGGALSTRSAEVFLHDAGLLKRGESMFRGVREKNRRRADQMLRTAVGEAMGVPAEGVRIAHSGMNAFFAAWTAVNRLQAGRGRPPRWIRLGWLYVDTMRILEKLSPAGSPPAVVSHSCDLDAVRQLLEAEPEGFAGIIAEVPGNPLAETPDVAALAALARQHGVALVLDPSVAGIWNVRVTDHADVVVTSLTKYAGSSGEVLAGAVAVNPEGPWAGELDAGIAAELEPLGREDAARLAPEIGSAPAVSWVISQNATAVAAFLEKHPAVDGVWWAERPGALERFAAVRTPMGGPGAIVTFTLRGTGGEDFAAASRVLAGFYDRVEIPKSPSFGTRFTMLCPYLYLAHYELVTTPEGRAELARCGLNPELIRISVGTEEPEAIIAALAAALEPA